MKTSERAELDLLVDALKHFGYRAPSSVHKDERPDFKLVVDGKTVGLETTFAVEQVYARAANIQAKKFPNEAYIVTNLRDGQKRESEAEIIQRMLDTDQPWNPVAQDEADHARRVVEILKIKQDKLNSPGFQLCDENWVLISSMPPMISYVRFRQVLAQALSSTPKRNPDFEAVFIRSGDFYFEWRQGNLKLYHRASGASRSVGS